VAVRSVLEPLVVTFRPDPGTGYGTVDCNWEDKPRKVPIAEWAAQNFADGWKAELRIEAPW
jgi:hypothetical protein